MAEQSVAVERMVEAAIEAYWADYGNTATGIRAALATVAPLDQLAGLVAGTQRIVSAEPDLVYDPSDDEGTVQWADRLDLTDRLEVGEVQHLKTLIAGPDKWAALVALTIDEDGYPDQTEIVFFNTEAEAMAAVGRPQPEGDRRG